MTHAVNLTDDMIQNHALGRDRRLKMGGLEDDIARGHVTGSENYHAFGYYETAGAVTTRTVLHPSPNWGIPSAAGSQITVVSSDPNDTAAGTGIRTVRIIYLDATYTPQTEDITLNGTTPVLTVATDIIFIQCSFALTFGSNTYAVGNISFSDGTYDISYISAGSLRCESSARMVPAGKRLVIKGMITGATSGTASASVIMRLVTSKFEGVDYSTTSAMFPLGGVGVQDNSVNVASPVPFSFGTGTVVAIEYVTDGKANVSGSWYGFLEDAN